ncbi:MAG: FecR domain-containing protein [Alphaproteobacteria bacterium]|nr:FecR domain-containing protein [Alphaproteobacteria bacterium]
MGLAGGAHAQAIGSVIELDPDAFGTPPGAARSELSLGAGVVSDELIETLATAAARLQFLDDGDLRIGANSSVLLDSLVYDPDQGAGELVLELAVGAARFVSGDMPDEGFELRTPVALVGIRGTDFAVLVEPNGRTIVAVFDGVVVVTPRGGQPVLVQAGQSIVVDPGLGPMPPGVMRPAEVDIEEVRIFEDPFEDDLDRPGWSSTFWDISSDDN